MERIKIALTKGRTEDQVVPLLEAAGINCEGLRNKQRRLIFDEDPRYEIILVKGPDVLTYLNNGSVQIGIVGSDILTEQENFQYAMLDLDVGRCRFVLASTKDFNPQAHRRKIIATKYPNITKRYFKGIGEDVEIIRIEGSVELAPLIGWQTQLLILSKLAIPCEKTTCKYSPNCSPSTPKWLLTAWHLGSISLRLKH